MLPNLRLVFLAIVATSILVTGVIAGLSTRIPVAATPGAGAPPDRHPRLALAGPRQAREQAAQAAARRSYELRRLLSIQIGPVRAEAGVSPGDRLNAMPATVVSLVDPPASGAIALASLGTPREVAASSTMVLQAAPGQMVAEARPLTVPREPAVRVASLSNSAALREIHPAAGAPAIVAREMPVPQARKNPASRGRAIAMPVPRPSEATSQRAKRPPARAAPAARKPVHQPIRRVPPVRRPAVQAQNQDFWIGSPPAQSAGRTTRPPQ